MSGSALGAQEPSCLSAGGKTEGLCVFSSVPVSWVMNFSKMVV